MPTYDYLCDACGHKFELFQSMTDPVQRKCPSCKKLKLRRLFGTGGAIMFKGSGFYQTDYRSDAYKKAASADSNANSGESKSSKASDKESSGSKSPNSSGDSQSNPKSSEKKAPPGRE